MTDTKKVLPITEESKLTSQQYKSFGPRPIQGWGKGAAIWAHVRYDDECRNGHNSFSITGTIRVPGKRDCAACGCLHEEIAQAFPELAHLIKWHLSSSDGPMHYIANTSYHAGDRDCSGRRKGEPASFDDCVQFGKNPIKHPLRSSFSKFLQDNRQGIDGEFDFEVFRIDYDGGERERNLFKPKFTFLGYANKWHECPFDTEREALDFLAALQTCSPKFLKVPTSWSDGKERELDAARHCAVWPEATDEELTAPGLSDRLLARLPGLLEAMRRDIEALGFVW